MSNERSKIGAAILGMFAAIKICRTEGYEPADGVRGLTATQPTSCFQG